MRSLLSQQYAQVLLGGQGLSPLKGGGGAEANQCLPTAFR